MLSTFFSSALKVRFALWAFEQALPSGADLKRRCRSALVGILSVVAGGVLLAITGAGLLIGGGFALHEYGDWSVLHATIAIMACLAALITGLILAGKHIFTKAFEPSAPAIPSSDGPSGDLFTELLNGFVAGFLKEPPPSEKEEQTEMVFPPKEDAHPSL